MLDALASNAKKAIQEHEVPGKSLLTRRWAMVAVEARTIEALVEEVRESRAQLARLLVREAIEQLQAFEREHPGCELLVNALVFTPGQEIRGAIPASLMRCVELIPFVPVPGDGEPTMIVEGVDWEDLKANQEPHRQL